jgi:amidase
MRRISDGSIRIPAACCGLYGFKPTAGLNSCSPYFTKLAHGFNSDHVVTRSVRDSAASLAVTAGGGSYLSSLRDAPGRLRILATVHTAEGRLAGENQVAAVEHTAALLRDLGHDVVLAEKSPLIAVGDWFDLCGLTIFRACWPSGPCKRGPPRRRMSWSR